MLTAQLYAGRRGAPTNRPSYATITMLTTSARFAPLLLLLACVGSVPDDSHVTPSLDCGEELTCAEDQLCVQVAYEPECTNLDDTGSSCPDGTTESHCGGDGHLCCCGETPPMTYSCEPAAACGATLSCDCVTCPDEKACSPTGADGTFTCESLPPA